MYKISNNINCVLFDLDGTLVDSTWIWREIDKIYLNRFHKKVHDNLQNEIEGMSFTETANYIKDYYDLKDSIETIKKDWNDLASDFYENKIELKKGAKNFLKYLSNREIKLGICTSNSRILTEKVLIKHNILDLFNIIITSCEVGKGKPNPDIYIHASKKLNCAPENCLVFEDTFQGVLSASRAHMQVIGIQDAFSIKNRHKIAKYTLKYIENFDKMK